MQMSRRAKLAAALLGWLSMTPVATVQAFPHSGVAQLSTGGYHTCALLADHHVACWGGSGLVAPSSTPTMIDGINNAVAVTSGTDFACALTDDKRVYCWGNNSRGQLGDGTHASRSTPKQTYYYLSPLAIAAGNEHLCVLRSAFDVFCWGSNSDGQLGRYELATGVDDPSGWWVYVHDGISNPRLSGVTAISSGNYHTCATLEDGSSACWGYNSDGELGDGTTASINSPSTVVVPNAMGVPVPFGMISGSMAGGAFNTCGLVPDGGASGTNTNSAACWGNNRYGAVGSPVGAFTTTPVAVRQFPGEKLYDVETIASGGNFTCALMKDTTLNCWGLNTYGQLGNSSTTTQSPIPLPVSTSSASYRFSKLAVGAAHACAIQDSQVLCWGRNLLGQLGQGTSDNSPHYIPQVVNLDAPIFTGNFDNN